MKRNYYYFVGRNKIPDHESMASFLLDESILGIGGKNDSISLYININDYFVPGSDAEPVLYDELPNLFDLYTLNGFKGVAEFVATKRGIENIYWKDKNKNTK